MNLLAFQLSETDAEMLIIGLLAMVAAMIFYKLDLMTKALDRTNELLAKIAEKGPK